MNNCPCYKCNERHESCHANCTRYLNFKIILSLERKKEREQKNIDYASCDKDSKREYKNKRYWRY